MLVNMCQCIGTSKYSECKDECDQYAFVNIVTVKVDREKNSYVVCADEQSKETKVYIQSFFFSFSILVVQRRERYRKK